MAEQTETGKKSPSLTEKDILRGMEALHGYVDLTPEDFRELFEKVYTFSRERLLREHTAADIMARPVFTIAGRDSVGDCIGLLAKRRISGVPVVNGAGMLGGVVSEKDILRLLGKEPDTHMMQLIFDSLEKPFQPPSSLLQKWVCDIMTTPAVSARLETSFRDLVRIFHQHRINRLPITDEKGRVEGIITRANMIRAISELL